jgi:hypothetical protein
MPVALNPCQGGGRRSSAGPLRGECLTALLAELAGATPAALRELPPKPETEPSRPGKPDLRIDGPRNQLDWGFGGGPMGPKY